MTQKDEGQFQRLVAITTRLQDLGYAEVFTDKREDIEYDLKQQELANEREKQRILREEKGWFYKIMDKETGGESEVHGPFT